METLTSEIVVFAQSEQQHLACLRLLKSHGYSIKHQSLLSDLNHDSSLAAKAGQFIKSHLDQKLSLDSISRAVGSNRSSLSYLFKEETGSCVFEWIRKIRMEKACELIISTRLSLLNISLEVGYENYANFSSCYKKHFGVSPSQHRKNSRRNIP